MKKLLKQTIWNYGLILIVIFSVFQIATATEVKITASDAAGGDVFGRSVSISGDYAIVGAYLEGGITQGSAYIFDRNQAPGWGQVTKLTASDAQDDDQFGWSVSISGDFAIVGARFEDGGAGDLVSNAGAAYIFDGTDNWSEVIKLTASDGAAADEFGCAVSISGDYVIVGARFENAGGAAAEGGAAYIFYRDEGGADNWGQVTKLIAGDAQAYARFGYSVSISGDYAIASASYENIGGNDDAGAAYIFDRNQAPGWGQVAKLIAGDADSLDQFGRFVSISGDYAIVGAWYEDGGSGDPISNAGAVYSFLRDGSSWNEKSKTMAGDAQAGDEFGCAVSISGDYAIAGAWYEDTGGGNAGAAYIYESVADLALPVELSSFTATGGDGQVTLEWVTESELQNDAFILKRSEDNDNFILLTEIKGQGNSSQQTRYSFTDFSVINGFTYYYRIADRSINGVVTWHTTIKATPNTVIDKFALHSNYPNPFNPETTIRFDVPKVDGELKNIKLQVYNTLGQLVETLYKGELNGGQYEMKWSGAQQSSGVYFLIFQSGQFVQTQKMILLR